MTRLAVLCRVLGWTLIALAIALSLHAFNGARRALGEPGLSRADEGRIEASAVAEASYDALLLAPAAAVAFLMATWARRRAARRA